MLCSAEDFGASVVASAASCARCHKSATCLFVLTSHRNSVILLWVGHMNDSQKKTDVWQGTLALMILRTLESMGPLHGYGIARRIEQVSGDRLVLNYGTIYPALLKLEQEGSIISQWGISENKRKAKYYRLTRAGARQLRKETQQWEQATEILARFLAPREQSS